MVDKNCATIGVIDSNETGRLTGLRRFFCASQSSVFSTFFFLFLLLFHALPFSYSRLADACLLLVIN